MTPWEIEGRKLSTPIAPMGAHANSMPRLRKVIARPSWRLRSKGHYGDVKFDGLRIGGIFPWPGAIHEGAARLSPSSTNEPTRSSARRYSRSCQGRIRLRWPPCSPSTSRHSRRSMTRFSPRSSSKWTSRRARAVTSCRPGREPRRAHQEPSTGAETRARIDLPAGFEFEIAEVGSGTTKTQGNVVLDLKASYGQFAHLHLNNHGVVRHRAA